jgi:hypothetical protein
MSLLVATQITAVATAILAVFAIVTAVFAFLAFRKQSDLLGIQRDQFTDQRQVNEEQARVLKLQATELEASLDQRKRDAESHRRAQANSVAAWFAWGETQIGPHIISAWGAVIRNDSGLPILNVRVFFYFIEAESPAAVEWRPIFRGGPPGRIRVIPPRSEEFVPIPESIKNMVDQCNESVYAVGIDFSDAHGNYWERNPRGALTATQPTSAPPGIDPA